MVTLKHLSIKQQPVIHHLHLLTLDAIAVSAAILDNAQEDDEYLSNELVISFLNDYKKIVRNLNESCGKFLPRTTNTTEEPAF
jgi:hypothetical protein